MINPSLVVFCTGGGGSICSMQVKALVSLGANATILGRRKPDVFLALLKLIAIGHG